MTTRQAELVGISFRTQSRVVGGDLIVLTAKYQTYIERSPETGAHILGHVHTVDASPGDLAAAVERGWIRSGERK